MLVAFQRQWPHFKNEKIKQQLALIFCIRRAYHKKREHRENPNAFYMHHKELEYEFGRNGFNKINERLNLFHISGIGSPSRGVTKQYLLDEKADRIYSTVLHRKPRGTLLRAIDANGRYINKAPAAVMSKDVAGVTAQFWSDEIKAQIVPVNIKVLDRLAEKIDEILARDDMFVRANKEKLEHRRLYTAELRREAHYDFTTGPGNIAHSYQESKTGRLSAIGINLQNAPRAVRKAALDGFWDYDFENCHYAILFQMAERFGLRCHYIEHYLLNKATLRTDLAQTIDVEISQIKRVLIALIYGAHASSSTKVALYDAIPDRSKLKALICHQTFTRLLADIRQAREVILNNWRTKRGKLINDCHKGIDATETKARRMAHLIQGVEANLLRTALRCYPSDIVLLLHDGFVSPHRLNKEKIRQAVKVHTGYDIALSEERLQQSADLDIESL